LDSLKASVQDGEHIQGAREETEQTSQAQNHLRKPLTNDDVISMVKANLEESTIILSIQTSSTAFDTSPQALISLKSQGVPPKVLDAMLAAGSEKQTPPAGPAVQTPANPASMGSVQGGSTKGNEIKGGRPDLLKIRKVYLETDWVDDDYARPRAIIAIQKHTCLRVVDTSGDEDASLTWSNEGLMGVVLDLVSKDGQILWTKRGLTAPLKALKQAVGCPN
jgi:hypothetical protein